ncbi:unnamed protein product [Angiostrongylus costaricensis]|uniref:Uncharacterized protein n=1 Tax=Angiostrongylus costaricensis TaxID=334426 RepID=A0A0R3PQ31_ANGCS|nr:unnamed protein product [Angiostrongylus costaricensis]
MDANRARYRTSSRVCVSQFTAVDVALYVYTPSLSYCHRYAPVESFRRVRWRAVIGGMLSLTNQRMTAVLTSLSGRLNII